MNTAQELKVYAQFQKILYVEDDTALRIETVNILKRFFMVVKSVSNGLDALELYNKENFDIILTDIRMPKMNGIEFSQIVKEKNKKQNIVVMSAHDETDYFIQLIRIGIDGFILKPADTEQFLYSLLQASESVECIKELEKLQYKAILEEITNKNNNSKKCPSKLSTIAKTKVESSENLKKVIEYIDNNRHVAIKPTVENLANVIAELHSLNDELEDSLSAIFSKESVVQRSDLEHFISIFKDYEMILKDYEELKEMSSIIFEIESIIDKIDLDNEEHLEGLSFLNSIYEDFIRFINIVIIEQSQTDIAYFYDCLASSLHELEIKLGLKDSVDYIEIF
jgi:YesN/AraC family two-component response regulator